MPKNKNLKIFMPSSTDDREFVNKITQELRDEGYKVVKQFDITSKEYPKLQEEDGVQIINESNKNIHPNLPQITYNMMNNITLNEHVDAIRKELEDFGITPNNEVKSDEHNHGGTVKDVKQQKLPSYR